MARQKTIKVKSSFEKQNKHSEFKLDFNKTNKYKIVFEDGYYATITDHTEHILNDDDVEAVLYSPEGKKKLINWVSAKADEAQFIAYNWFMQIQLLKNNIYSLTFYRGKSVGGGVL